MMTIMLTIIVMSIIHIVYKEKGSDYLEHHYIRVVLGLITLIFKFC